VHNCFRYVHTSRARQYEALCCGGLGRLKKSCAWALVSSRARRAARRTQLSTVRCWRHLCGDEPRSMLQLSDLAHLPTRPASASARHPSSHMHASPHMRSIEDAGRPCPSSPEKPLASPPNPAPWHTPSPAAAGLRRLLEAARSEPVHNRAHVAHCAHHPSLIVHLVLGTCEIV